MLQSYHLHQFVTQPTYSSGSLLDVVISNSNDAVQRVGVFDCAFSPHSYVRSLLMFTKCRSKPSRVRTRILKHIDHSSLLRDLYFVDWTGVFTSDSVADMWSHLLALLAPVIDKHAPVKCISIRNPTAPPVTSATIDLMAQRRGVLRREGKSPAFRDLYRRVRSAIRRDCRAGIVESLRAQGSSSLYRSIRSILAGKKDGALNLPAATPDEMNRQVSGGLAFTRWTPWASARPGRGERQGKRNESSPPSRGRVPVADAPPRRRLNMRSRALAVRAGAAEGQAAWRPSAAAPGLP